MHIELFKSINFAIQINKYSSYQDIGSIAESIQESKQAIQKTIVTVKINKDGRTDGTRGS
jgi:hypothetical protein